MAQVTIKAGEVNSVIKVGNDGKPLFPTKSFQVAATKGTGTLTFKAKGAGSAGFEDILDSEGGVIGTLDFDSPVIFKVINSSVVALQTDASGLSGDVIITVTPL